MKTLPDSQATDETRADAMLMWESVNGEFDKIFDHYIISQVVAPDLHPLMLDEDMVAWLDTANKDTLALLFLAGLHRYYDAMYPGLLAMGRIAEIRREFAHVEVKTDDDEPQAD